MCATCGCSSGGVVRLMVAEHDHDHHHGRTRDHEHSHGHGDHGHAYADHVHPDHGQPDHVHPDHLRPDQGHGDPGHPDHGHGDPGHPDHGPLPAEVQVLESSDGPRTIELQQKVLAKNDELAQHNREWLRQRGILAVNLMSSPGAGKTTLLERTMRSLAENISISVVEGDQETALDASRILAAGSSVVQINTGVGCHLDAEMLARGLRALNPPSGSIVMIENVGNLVCPALFDLGEQARVVLASVTEGADKPLKYPHMFRQADLVLLNKTDLLPYVDFDVREYASGLRQVTPDALLLQVSATTGDGMHAWYDWLRRRTPAPSE
jgi:hydrogenase nickel incorporation protein HypB